MGNQQGSNLKAANAVITLALTIAAAVFVLALAVKIGSGVANLLDAEGAEAAPAVTATPVVVETVVAASPTPESTALPTEESMPTATPTPTATPMPTATLEPTPVPLNPRLIAGENGVNVRVGPSTVYEKIGYLEPSAEVPVTGESHGWWQIDYGGEEAFVFGEIVTAFDVADVPEVTPPEVPSPTIDEPVFEPAPIWAIDEDRWIDVDLSEQRVTAYEGQTPVKSYLVSTGLPSTPTPEGQFRIWVKFRYDDMAGADYYLEDVPWVMYFYQGYGFHGVWWHANWGHPMSHGCVNQPNEMAEWLFNFADVGTLVNIHQ
ncbi:MAG: L,D-transpeptidase family protein [Anaerolineae bacterium]